MHCSLSRRSLHASSQSHQVDSSSLSCSCFICPPACLEQSFTSYISYNYRRNEKEMAANSVFHTLCIYPTSLVRPYSNYSACYRHRNVFAATTILQEIDNRHDTAREREHGWQWVDKVNLHNEFCDTHSLTLLLIWWLTVVVHLPLPACLSQLMQYKFITNSRYWFTVGVWVQVNGTSHRCSVLVDTWCSTSSMVYEADRREEDETSAILNSLLCCRCAHYLDSYQRPLGGLPSWVNQV